MKNIENVISQVTLMLHYKHFMSYVVSNPAAAVIAVLIGHHGAN